MIEVPMLVYAVLLASFSCTVTYLLVWSLDTYNSYKQRKVDAATRVQLKLEELDRLHYTLKENHKRLVTKVDTLLERLDD